MAEQGQAGGVSVEGLPPWQLARRQRIVEAAVGALETQEYEQIQIRDVSASAEVAQGTLYRYFSSKEHLYAAVLQEWAAFDRVRPARGTGLAPVERVRRRAHSVIRALKRQPQFFKAYVLLQTSSDPNARALLLQFAQLAENSLADEFDTVQPDEAHDMAIMLWSIINSMVAQAIYQSTPMSKVHQVVDRFIDLLEPDLG